MVAETTSKLGLIELPGPDQVFGRTSGMRAVRTKIDEVMTNDLPVLIEGESGTGKEVVARYLHMNSPRCSGPFVRVNCGVIQGAALDDEIFGEPPDTSVRSDQQVVGSSVGLAAGGTLFFDGVSEVDWSVGQRLAKVLSAAARVNARLVCASTQGLQNAAGNERFSNDLDRCFKHRVLLLPLRERAEDIPLLCVYLSEKFARNYDRPIPRLSPYMMELFQHWSWPGNIRELENWIARIVIFGTDEAIGLEFRRQMGLAEESLTRRHRGVHLNFTRLRRSTRHT